MQFVVDPVWLAPPAEPQAAWMKKMSELRSLITDGGVLATCPSKLRDIMYARWFEEGCSSELARYLNEISDRLVDDVDLSQGPVLVDNVNTEPSYCGHDSDSFCKEFTDHLGEAALAKGEGDPHAGVLTELISWSTEAAHIDVEAEVGLREDPGGEWFEPEDDDAMDVRVALSLATCPSDIIKACADYPMALMNRIDFGVKAYWAGILGGNAADLKFEVGPAFNASVKAMNYQRNKRYAASCLRVMGLIGSGRDHEVDGHEEREGAGAGNPVVKDRAGNVVMRAYLAKDSPDANRLFWVRGDHPKFLNVTGHEGKPAI